MQLIVAKPSFHDFYLEPGHHSYKFSFALPHHLPSSFEHPSGRIRYKVFCLINFPMKYEVPIFRSFTVLSILDLNMYENLRSTDTVNITTSRKVCCCFHSGHVMSSLTVLKAGYVSGESIVFSLNINNNSSRTIRYVTIKLVQRVTIQNRSTFREVAAFYVTDPIGSRMAKNIYNAIIPIPPVCPTSNDKSKLIKVNYFLLLTLKSPRRRIRLRTDEITIPIGNLILDLNALN